MRIVLIVNPMHRASRRAARVLEALCSAHGAHCTLRTTDPVRPAGRSSAAPGDPSADLCVVVGGDGTMREAAGALLTAGQPSDRSHSAPPGRSTVPMLPVPTGAADLFAFNLGIRTLGDAYRRLRTFLDRAPEASLIRADAALIRFTRPDGSTTPALPFLVDAGMGASAEAVLRTSARAKELLGAAGYATGAVRTLLRRPRRFRVVTDPGNGGMPLTSAVSAWSVEIGGIRSIPAGITVFPHGGLDTGTLALLAVRGEGLPWSWGSVVRAGVRGGESAALWTAASRTVRVESTQPVPVHVDGEAAGWALAAEARALPGALRILG